MGRRKRQWQRRRRRSKARERRSVRERAFREAGAHSWKDVFDDSIVDCENATFGVRKEDLEGLGMMIIARAQVDCGSSSRAALGGVAESRSGVGDVHEAPEGRVVAEVWALAVKAFVRCRSVRAMHQAVVDVDGVAQGGRPER